MVEVTEDYVFDGPDGRVRLIDLFEGRPQLVIYHFMFDPDADKGCPSCSAGTDEVSDGFLDHLHTRGTSYAMVSRAPFAKLERWKAEKGWNVPWYSSFDRYTVCACAVVASTASATNSVMRRIRGVILMSRSMVNLVCNMPSQFAIWRRLDKLSSEFVPAPVARRWG